MRALKVFCCTLSLLFGTQVLCAQESQEASGRGESNGGLQIRLASLFVEDQDKALEFYTEIVGFVTKTNIPIGEFKWLTVVSPDNPNGTELLLEPNNNPAAKTYQEAIFAQGIPATSFFVADIEQEYERLKALGVEFTMEPTAMGDVTLAIFDDTCGNLIQIAQE